MIKSFNYLASFIGIFFVLLTAQAFADNTSEYYIEQALDRYFQLPMDASTISMAGSTALTCRSSSCIFLNPAGLGFVDSFSSDLSIETSRRSGNDFGTEEDIEQLQDQGYLALAVPLQTIFGGSDSETEPESKGSRYGTLALAYSRYKGETDDRIRSIPDGHRRSAAYGIEVAPSTAVGYSFTFYDDQLRSELADLHSHARFLHIFGMQYEISEDVLLGITYRYGQGQSDTEDIRLQSNGLSYPREHSATIALQKNWQKEHLVAVSAGYSHFNSRGSLETSSDQIVVGNNEGGERYHIAVGNEYSPLEVLHIRTGLRWYDVFEYDFETDYLSSLSGKSSGVGVSAGLGYDFTRSWALNYGANYLDTSRGSWLHSMTLSYVY